MVQYIFVRREVEDLVVGGDGPEKIVWVAINTTAVLYREVKPRRGCSTSSCRSQAARNEKRKQTSLAVLHGVSAAKTSAGLTCGCVKKILDLLCVN